MGIQGTNRLIGGVLSQGDIYAHNFSPFRGSATISLLSIITSTGSDAKSFTLALKSMVRSTDLGHMTFQLVKCLKWNQEVAQVLSIGTRLYWVA